MKDNPTVYIVLDKEDLDIYGVFMQRADAEAWAENLFASLDLVSPAYEIVEWKVS